MSADSHLSEALCRIEFKLDLIINCLVKLDPVKQMIVSGAELSDHYRPCPVCNREVRHDVDITSGVVVRKCGCGTKKIPNTLLIGGNDGGGIQGTKGGAGNGSSSNL